MRSHVQVAGAPGGLIPVHNLSVERSWTKLRGFVVFKVGFELGKLWGYDRDELWLTMIKWEYHQQYWLRECQNFEQDSDVAIKPTSNQSGFGDIIWYYVGKYRINEQHDLPFRICLINCRFTTQIHSMIILFHTCDAMNWGYTRYTPNPPHVCTNKLMGFSLTQCFFVLSLAGCKEIWKNHLVLSKKWSILI